MLAADLEVPVQSQVDADLARAAADRYFFLVKLPDFGCGRITINTQPPDLNRKDRIFRRPWPDDCDFIVFLLDRQGIERACSLNNLAGLIHLSRPYYSLG